MIRLILLSCATTVLSMAINGRPFSLKVGEETDVPAEFVALLDDTGADYRLVDVADADASLLDTEADDPADAPKEPGDTGED